MMFLLSRNFFLLIACFLKLLAANSQAKLGQGIDFSNEPVVYSVKKEHVNIVLNKEQAQVECTSLYEKLIQTDRIGHWSDEYIYYRSFVEIEDIKAELLVPYKNKYKSYAPSNVVFQDKYSSNSFYDDGKLKRIIFPNSPKGSMVKLSYVEKYSNNDLFGICYFSTNIPVIYSEFSVTFPEEVEINYKLFNLENKEVIFNKEKNKKTITYNWIMKDVKSFPKNYSGFSISYFEPHILLSIKSINKKVNINSYEDLYKKYISLMRNPYPNIDPIFKEVVDSICENRITDQEKLEAIYYFTQSKIQYIAIENGYAGIIPENPLTVYKRRYGDCKGKSNLLVTLLRQANIKAWLTWVGSRNKPYKYTDCPSVYIDDHMIVTALLDGKEYSLDATEIFLHFTFPSPFTQGKESLIGVDETECRIVEIPIVDYSRNSFENTVELNVDNRNLLINGKASFTGYYKNDLTTEILRRANDKKADIIKKWLCKRQEKSIIDSVKFSNLESRLDTLIVDYWLEVPDYVRIYDNHIYINPFIERKYENSTIDTVDFVYNKYLNYSYLEKLNIKLNIPKGYTLESIPNSLNLEFENFGYEVKYSSDEKTVCVTEKIYIKNPYVGTSEFKKWNQMIKEITKVYNQSISLKK